MERDTCLKSMMFWILEAVERVASMLLRKDLDG